MVDKTWQGYTISKRQNGYTYPVYVKSVYKGEIKWTTDYLYAKHYTEKAARRIDKEIDKAINDGTFADKNILADVDESIQDILDLIAEKLGTSDEWETYRADSITHEQIVCENKRTEDAVINKIRRA